MHIIDLFSGPGGLSLGLRRAGLKVLANVEINRDAMTTYTSHDSDAIHFNEDVRRISFSPFRGKVDIVVGGPPCQPFSIGGLQKGKADKRDMIPEFIRCLEEVQPEAFLMENVPGLIFKKARPYFDDVLVRLADCGYQLNWAVLNSADYGVPQKRKRLIVLGARNRQLKFPMPSHGPETKHLHIKALDILGDNPIGDQPNCPVKYAKYPDLRLSPYAGHIYNGGGRPIDPDGPCHTILASSGGYKTHWLDTANIAPAYHAHLRAGGAPWEGAVPGARRLSVEECALIQTFPQDLNFSGKRSAQYKQVGDAVPPELAFAVGKALIAQLNGHSNTGEFIEKIKGVNAIQDEMIL
ncbi:DNA-cytosine methyltransferase [Desulfuromonas soudanensis]|uniref:Cytosine-specific methyltransferase n=1 Tax=Desulfuromonas soudanensis TaxID=1603606 RepID=A0A0M4D917_9BACT|nr:DNA cytosine methyltransferase [Desulfuromonas soudanensis]ALC16342.1 DNA-cytosine methyltransferase [Desulfuromonas soudanensis]